MAIVAEANPKTLIAGDPFTAHLSIAVDGVAIATDTTVQARLINDKANRNTAVELIAPVTVTWDADLSKWVLNFTDTQTRAIRETASDSLGPLAYDKVWLEVQLGSPYNRTRFFQIDCGKGTID